MAKTVTIHLTDAQAAELESLAAERGVSVAKAIEDVISRDIDGWQQAVLSERRTRDSIGWRSRLRDHIAKRYAQKGLPKDF